MTEKSVIVPSLVLTYSGVFSLSKIEDTIKAYMSKTNYVLEDVSHDIAVKEKEKNQSITFLFTFEPHTQEQCRLQITVSAIHIVPLIHRGSNTIEQLYEGDLKINMRATTYSNADEHKQHKKVEFALGTLFRKFVFDSEKNETGAEMKKFCYDIYDQIYGLVHMGKRPEGYNA